MGALALAALAPPAAAAEAAPGRSFTADASASTFAVLVSKAGLLSGFAHDHRLVPSRWRARARLDPGHPEALEVEVVVEVASLRDTAPRLTAGNRAQVDRETASPAVLDAARHPEIRFRSREAAGLPARAGEVLEGVLRGELALHGATRPLEVAFRAVREGEGYRVKGGARFAQTDFGITPFSSAMGTIGVDDEVRVEFELVLRPDGPPPGGPEAGASPEG
jgi:polyisoprenoid-binding protein YceI